MPNTSHSSKGFTLVELLIVISIIGILAGLVLSVLNPTALGNRAKDGVRVGNVAKIAQAAEAFNAAEGDYAETQTDLINSGYIKNWPTDPDTTISYQYGTPGDSDAPEVACVAVPMATNPTKFFKYISHYGPGVNLGSLSSNDVGKVVKNCDSNCSGNFSGNDLAGCTLL